MRFTYPTPRRSDQVDDYHGTPVADPKKPLEVLRTVHSFDPCIACGVHVIDPDSNQVYKIKAL